MAENKIDDSKELVTIDYFDRINNKWIKVEITKEVARFMKADKQQRRRKQNQYDYYNKPYDEIFDEDKHPENMHFLCDDTQNPEYILAKKEEALVEKAKKEQQRTIIENSLCDLTAEQREVVEMAMYDNMSYKKIGENLNISKQSVSERRKNAEKNIKKHINNTEN